MNPWLLQLLEQMLSIPDTARNARSRMALAPGNIAQQATQGYPYIRNAIGFNDPAGETTGPQGTGPVQGPVDPGAPPGVPGMMGPGGGRDTGIYNGPPVPGSNAAPGSAPGGAPPGGPGASVFSPPGDNPVPAQARNALLYPVNDPQMAMMNVLMDRGYNPFKTNPFVSQIMNAAGGLGNLWQLSNIGAKPGDIAANGGPEAMFRDFLVHQLSTGNTFGALAQGQQMFPQYLNQLRDMQQSINSGATPVTDVSSFVGGLESQLNSPKGFADVYGSLVSPLMGGLAGSYDKALNRSTFGGWRNYIGNPAITPDLANPPNFFDVLMGRR